MEKLKIPYPIIVEGKYDRLRLLSVLDADIYTTDGFGIFRKNEKAALFRALAKKTKLIVLTDPDGAGSVIRAHLSGILPREAIIPLYVPQIKGKESRKKTPSAAGFLGVEGQEAARIRALFAPFSTAESKTPKGVSDSAPRRAITKADFFEDGLTGIAGAAERRALLAAHFALPPDMTPNALLAALSIIATFEEYRAAARDVCAQLPK